MKKTMLSKLSKFIFMFLLISTIGVNSNAEEVVLCVSETEQYVDMVGEKGVCVEGENEVVISGTDIAQKKEFTPVANFKDYSQCDGEGSTTEIGFDQNNNGTLDQDEIVGKRSVCNPSDTEGNQE